jgi:hypothetical protein
MLPPSYFGQWQFFDAFMAGTQPQNTLYDKLELSGSGVF